MARTLLTWRWAALTLLLVAAVAGMVLLGQWQWQRSVPEAAREAVALDRLDPATLPDALAVSGTSGPAVPEGASGELVRLSGVWRPDRTLLLADRELDGTAGRWAVTAVEVAVPGQPDLLVPVVRGWLPAAPGSPAQPVPAPAGATGEPVELVGWLQQAEPLDVPVDIWPPDGVVPLLAAPDLVNRWPERVAPGFVVLAPTPAQAGAAGDLRLLSVAPEELTRTRDWRNLAYSAQWFLFAGFAVVLWWRMLRDETVREQDREDLDHVEEDLVDPSRPEHHERTTT